MKQANQETDVLQRLAVCPWGAEAAFELAWAMAVAVRVRFPSKSTVYVLLGGLFMLTACSQKQPGSSQPRSNEAVPVTVARIETMALDRVLAVYGTLFPKDEAVVSAEVEGRVEKTLVDMGDRIEPSQELAQIDTASYEAQAQLAAANHAKARAHAAHTEQDLKRVQELRKSGISSLSDLDLALAQAEQSQAEANATAAAEAIARLSLARSHVKAPFVAAIAERIVSAGDFVRVGTPLFRVVNDSVLKFIAQAPERYAAQVKREQTVRLRVDGFSGQTFEGKVFLISPSVNTATRAFSFGALVPNPERQLKANMYARGELVFDRGVPTPIAPLEAIINFAGVTKVFVVERNVARSREVQVGPIHAGRQEILAGVQAGEWVVLTGHTKLQDGAKVRIQTPAAEPAVKATRHVQSAGVIAP